jgi:hypothetical protein
VEAQISICMEYMVNEMFVTKSTVFRYFSGWWFIRFDFEEGHAYSGTYSW